MVLKENDLLSEISEEGIKAFATFNDDTTRHAANDLWVYNTFPCMCGLSTPERNCIGGPEQNCITTGLALRWLGYAARKAGVLGRASGQALQPRSGALLARGLTARARTERSSGSRDARLFMVANA
jgi:hypothetical protein